LSPLRLNTAQLDERAGQNSVEALAVIFRRSGGALEAANTHRALGDGSRNLLCSTCPNPGKRVGSNVNRGIGTSNGEPLLGVRIAAHPSATAVRFGIKCWLRAKNATGTQKPRWDNPTDTASRPATNRTGTAYDKRQPAGFDHPWPWDEQLSHSDCRRYR